MNGDENYILLESFGIDDGELDGNTPQECFVLGWELCNVSRRTESESDEFEMLIHADNIERVTTAIEKRGRARIVTWLPNDLSEGWVKLTVMKAREQ